MASANLTMGVTGIDKTGAAFNSVRNRAKATGAQIRSIMGGAIAAAGAYLGVRSIKGAVDELGKLSDLAMKSGTSVEELTKSATAFQIAGLDLSVESLARSFQYMRKQTGEGGLDNFYKIASSIASIEDPAKRGAELVKNFGRAGLELQPLINGGEEAIEKMRTLTEVMPGVSTAAANAGDAAADSLTALGKGAQSVMLRAVGKIISLWSDDFPGGIRAGALSAANWLEYFARKSMATVTKWGHNIGAALGWWQMLFTEGYDRANEVFAAVTDEYEREDNAKLEKIEADRKAFLEKLKTLNVDDLANAFDGVGGKGGNTATHANVAEAVSRAVRVSNSLIMGGSNAERRLSVLGPTYQNEQKKQTEYLKTIAKNTEKTAENTEGGEDLQVLDP